MCGPSGEETLAQQQEAGLSQMLDQVFQDRFASQTATLQELNTQLQQLQAGVAPQGFSSAEMAARTTQNINQNAAATRAAQQAASDAIAGQGGGAANPAGLPSGVQAAVRGNIAATEAANLSTEQNELQMESAAVGRQQQAATIAGLETLARIQSPAQYGSLASSATGQSFQMADTIQQQRNQVQADIAGGITGLAEGGLTFASGAIGGGLKGGLQALAGSWS